MSRRFLTAVLAAAGISALSPPAMAQFNMGPGISGPFDPAARATTVKSSKSNTSDRVGGPQGTGGTAKTTTIKTTKSNTFRTGGPQGTGGTARTTTVKSSKSNSSD